MNEGQNQNAVVTATAKIVVEPDTTKWDEFKTRAEQDIAGLGEKLKAAFSVQLEDFGAKIAEEVARLNKARESSATDAPQQNVRSQDGPDQLLAHITIIENNTERIAKATEEMAEAATTQQ